jgi:hypothetical protein
LLIVSIDVLPQLQREILYITVSVREKRAQRTENKRGVGTPLTIFLSFQTVTIGIRLFSCVSHAMVHDMVSQYINQLAQGKAYIRNTVFGKSEGNIY